MKSAATMFANLGDGGTVTEVNEKFTRVDLPNNGGTIMLRTYMTKSPGVEVTIDVNIPGIPFDKVKFKP